LGIGVWVYAERINTKPNIQAINNPSLKAGVKDRVYKLYGLTEEEIKIVEDQNSSPAMFIFKQIISCYLNLISYIKNNKSTEINNAFTNHELVFIISIYILSE